MAKRFVVTGANKGAPPSHTPAARAKPGASPIARAGIGLAIARGLADAGAFVYLGSRDAARGQARQLSVVVRRRTRCRVW